MNKTKKYFEGDRPEMARFLPDSYEKVLEIGCGDTSFRRNMKPDCEYWGVEPADIKSTNTGSAGVTVLKGYFHEVYDSLPDSYFDLVVCNDVIEHVSDHDEFLIKIKKKLADQGVIIGSIPNVRYYDNLFHLLRDKDWHYTESGILDGTHLRFFTEKSLIDTFSKNDFEIELFSGINNFLSRTKSIRKVAKYFYLQLVLTFFSVRNSDIKFQQFGFRVRNKWSRINS